MDGALFLSIVRQLRELDYRGGISYHFYNEPLLSPDLERFTALTREHLPESRIQIYTNGTLLDEPKLRRLVAAGVDKFTVTKHHGTKQYVFDDVYPRLEPSLQERIKFQTYRDIYYTNRGGLVRAGDPRRAPPLDLPCFVPSSVMVITVNGNVLPCYEDYEELNVMGNLRERSLKEIWWSEKYRRFREDLKEKRRSLHPVCRTCNRASIIS